MASIEERLAALEKAQKRLEERVYALEDPKDAKRKKLFSGLHLADTPEQDAQAPDPIPPESDPSEGD